MRRVASVVLALAFAAASAGCGGDGDDGAAAAGDVQTGTYVGLVDDTDASIAIATDGDRVVGYVCDGQDVSLWLEGDVGGIEADLVLRNGGRAGDVTFENINASGEIEIDGERHGFFAELASGEAGLYREEEGEPGRPGYRETGWIVLPDGSEKGRRNVITPGGTIETEPAGTRSEGATFIDPTNGF